MMNEITINETSINEYDDGYIKRITHTYKNKLHNENGPATISYLSDGTRYREEYWINGIRHRSDGPAFIQYDTSDVCRELYFYNGIQCDVNKTLYEYDDLKLQIYQSKTLQEFYGNKILINRSTKLSDKEKLELHEINDSGIVLEQLMI